VQPLLPPLGPKVSPHRSPLTEEWIDILTRGEAAHDLNRTPFPNRKALPQPQTRRS
jgi:hypothetical protein